MFQVIILGLRHLAHKTHEILPKYIFSYSGELELMLIQNDMLSIIESVTGGVVCLKGLKGLKGLKLK